MLTRTVWALEMKTEYFMQVGNWKSDERHPRPPVRQPRVVAKML
jgi:hypothetical protein